MRRNATNGIIGRTAGTEKTVLTPSDFTYLGAVGIPLTEPPQGANNFAYQKGGLACRYVGADLHIFITGKQQNGGATPETNELIYNATPTTNLAALNRCTWYRQWPDIFNGGLAVSDSNGAINFGLLWDGEKLIYSFSAWYSGEYCRALGACTFNGTTSSTSYGPWRPTCHSKQVNGLPGLIPERHRSAFGGRNCYGGGVNASINNLNTWGFGFEAYSSANMLSLPADSLTVDTERSISTQRVMFADAASPMTRAATAQKCDRGVPETGYSCVAGPTTIYDPTTSWTYIDGAAGSCWIDNETKHGLVYIGSLVDRVNDATFRTNNYNGDNIPHYWYSLSGINCCHSHVTTGNGTGPHTPSSVPQMWIYDPATILSAAASTITPYQAANTPATSHKHLYDYSSNFRYESSIPYGISCCYDSVSRLFFISWSDAEYLDPYASVPLIYVFQVAA